MYENPMEINEGLLSKAPCVHLFFGFHFFHLESALFFGHTNRFSLLHSICAQEFKGIRRIVTKKEE